MAPGSETGAGWLLVLLSTFIINHFDLFGLKQVTYYLRQKQMEPLTFQVTLFYKLVCHPLMLGFIIAFWATPEMTLGHLVFALATTGYILVGIYLEERDLVHALGEDYVQYRKRTPMLVPFTKRKSAGTVEAPSSEAPTSP